MLRLGVAVGRPLNAVIDADRFGFRDADDRLMVAAARLALDLALPTEDAGSQVLPAPEREIVWVRHLYEKAVAGFYRVVLEPLGWRVCAGRGIEWQIEAKTPGIDAILPAMRTDIVLEQAGSGQRVVIDTKFNCLVRTGWYREEALRSAYIYQIYAYLRSQVGAGDPLADHAAGMLLHPAVGEAFDEIVVIQGHPIRFATVDLSAPAAEIRRRLLSLVPFPLGFDAVTPLGISFLGGSGPST
jgi:5-methylcytosine-specific restriction enzyme subunit McrC